MTSHFRSQKIHLGLAIFFCLLVGFSSATNAAENRSVDFNSGWRFHLGDAPAATNVAFNDSAWRTLDLPHDFSAEGGFSPTNASCTGFLPGGVGWYRKTFTLDSADDGRRVFVEFDGVMRNSDVWLNGVHLGHRPYGYSSFHYDLTPHLRFGGATNLLAVRCERENVADSRWYPGSGIHRNVRLATLPPVHIPIWGVFVTTPRITTNAADVVVNADVRNTMATNCSARLIVQWLDSAGKPVREADQTHAIAAGETFTFTVWGALPNPRLWSPESPALYTAVCRVFLGADPVDETRTTFGIREARFDAQHGFFLNGVNLKLKGVCVHHDAGALGAAVPVEVWERRLRVMKELGVNAVRCSHNPMSSELYELCDRLGLLVLDEAFDEWEIGKRKWVAGRNQGTAQRFGYSADFQAWAERDCADMVRRDRNHPSIIAWSLGNEIDYPTDPYVHDVTRAVEGFERDSRAPQMTQLTAVAPKLIAAVKRHDATRPVTMALANQPATDATGLAQMLDVVGYNYQEEFYDKVHRAFPGRVILGSENGKSYDAWRAVTENDFVAG
ncbi:MAG: glycoside hydrolase family 2, partial [Verrucomicrobia bacterium]